MIDVVILGAGVIGLSIALELQKKGVRVVIVGKDLPEDVQSTGFASPWAGCNWHSFFPADTREGKWDAVTFKRLAQLSQQQSHLVQRLPFYDVSETPVPVEASPFHSVVYGMRAIEASDDHPLPGGYPYAHKYESFVMNAPAYIQHLAAQLRKAGVKIIRHRVGSLDEAYNIEGLGTTQFVVNATGLGAKSLIGVEDGLVYPARGQTVLVRAPRVDQCVCFLDTFTTEDKDARPPAYIIPRPGSGGMVVCGGTFIRGNYSTLPDPKEAERILKDCFELDPRLAKTEGGSWEDIEIVSHNVGARPARDGGPRLELEDRVISFDALVPGSTKGKPSRRVKVLHAYGLGPGGFQASVGMAEEAAEMIMGALSPSASL